MKRLLITLFMALCVLSSFAQSDVTTFLGIPVDGLKSDMKRKLIAKGFTPDRYDQDVLEGEFNGMDVIVGIVTNNNKVYRIVVKDKIDYDETNIKIRFNNLVRQFENNKRYISIAAYSIPESEDISYEMSIHKKRYQAEYYQISQEMLSELNTEEVETKKKLELFEQLFKKPVWFMIGEKYGRYQILMYYDNVNNQANGDDL